MRYWPLGKVCSEMKGKHSLRLPQQSPKDKLLWEKKRVMHLPAASVPAMKQTSGVVSKSKNRPSKPLPVKAAEPLKDAFTKRSIVLNSLRILRERDIAQQTAERSDQNRSSAGTGLISGHLANYKIPKKKSEPERRCSEDSPTALQASPVNQRLSGGVEEKSPTSPNSLTVQVSPKTPTKQPDKLLKTSVKLCPLDRILEDMNKTHGPVGRKRNASPEKVEHPATKQDHPTRSPSSTFYQARSWTPNHKQTPLPKRIRHEQPPTLCKLCNRRQASDSSSDGTCVTCRLSQDITKEQAVLKAGSPTKSTVKTATAELPVTPSEKKKPRYRHKSSKERRKERQERKKKKRKCSNEEAVTEAASESVLVDSAKKFDRDISSSNTVPCETIQEKSAIATSEDLAETQTPVVSHVSDIQGICCESDETLSDCEPWSDDCRATLSDTKTATNVSDDCGDDADTQGIASEYESEPECIVVEETTDDEATCAAATPVWQDSSSDDVVVVEEEKHVEVINIDDLSDDEGSTSKAARIVPFSLSFESGMLSVTLGSQPRDLSEQLSAIRAHTEKDVDSSTKAKADSSTDTAVIQIKLESDDNAVLDCGKVVHEIKHETVETLDADSSLLPHREPATGDAEDNAIESTVVTPEEPSRTCTSAEPRPSDLLEELHDWADEGACIRAADTLMQKYVTYIHEAFDVLESWDTETRSVLVDALVPHGFLALKRIMDLIQAITERTEREDTVKVSSLGLRIFTLFMDIEKLQSYQPQESVQLPSEQAYTDCGDSARVGSVEQSSDDVPKGLEEILQSVFSNSILKSLPLEQLLSSHSPDVPEAPEKTEDTQLPAEPRPLPAVPSEEPKELLHKTVGSQTEDLSPTPKPKGRNLERIPKAMVRPRKPSLDDYQATGKTSPPSCLSSRGTTGSISAPCYSSAPCSDSFQKSSPVQKHASWPFTATPVAAFQQTSPSYTRAPQPLNSAVPCYACNVTKESASPGQNVPLSSSSAVPYSAPPGAALRNVLPPSTSAVPSSVHPAVTLQTTSPAQNAPLPSHNAPAWKAAPGVALRQTCPAQNGPRYDTAPGAALQQTSSQNVPVNADSASKYVSDFLLWQNSRGLSAQSRAAPSVQGDAHHPYSNIRNVGRNTGFTYSQTRPAQKSAAGRNVLPNAEFRQTAQVQNSRTTPYAASSHSTRYMQVSQSPEGSYVQRSGPQSGFAYQYAAYSAFYNSWRS